MRGFITDDFLLSNHEARELYFEFAHELPIVDFHCHLPPALIAEDHNFANLTEIWLAGDHYKWRAMRSNGIPERFITGDATDREKFDKWAETVPMTLRNPLYHWTHLELRRPFGINDRVLDPATAPGIWDECNAMLASPEFSCQGILKQMNVEVVCTTDDPTDSLEAHRRLAADVSFRVRVLPTFRPDRGMAVENPATFNTWISRLEEATGADVKSYDDFMNALKQRHSFFHELGCRASDHGMETVYADDYTDAEIRAIFARVRGGKPVTIQEARQFKSAFLHEVAMMNHGCGWVMQLHLGVIRNNNTRMMKHLGPDTGFDSIGDFEIARPLARFLDRLDQTEQLPRTILYNINPRDNELLATMLGNFQDGRIPGKIQYGSGWWFLDQKDGMERQMDALSNMGLLSRFVGMVTDSRSFLSYTRHEYFRRILCNMLGRDMEAGLLPRDMNLVGGMVRAICHDNARQYFGLDTGDT